MEALQFYAEAHPLGVIGSFLLDKFPEVSSYFRFKHHFLLHAIDSEILYTLVLAMCEQDDIELKMYDLHTGNPEFVVQPFDDGGFDWRADFLYVAQRRLGAAFAERGVHDGQSGTEQSGHGVSG